MNVANVVKPSLLHYLNNHIRIHTRLKPNKNDTCGKSLKAVIKTKTLKYTLERNYTSVIHVANLLSRQRLKQTYSNTHLGESILV